MKVRTAAVLVIGNEILSGKLADRNVHFIANQLASIGISLRRVIVCPDEVSTIRDDVRQLSATHDVVFTTGGVGPTHDDLTYQAVAAAFDVPTTLNAELEGLIRERFGEKTTVQHLRMAEVPEGSELVVGKNIRWPTVCKGNVYVFPGVPEIIVAKFASILARLDQGIRFFRSDVLLLCDEFEIATELDAVDQNFDDVQIGSYLNWKGEVYRVRLTFEGTSRSRVQEAIDALVATLDKALIHDVSKVETLRATLRSG